MSITIKIFVSIACGIAVTVFFVFIADLPNKQPNGFTRSFLYPKTLSPERSIQTESDVRQVISLTARRIYLSTDIPNKIQVKDYKLLSAGNIRLSFYDALPNSIGNAFSLQIDSPNVYIFAHNIPAIVHNSINKGVNQIISLPGSAFSHAVALSENTFILRQFRKSSQDQHFIKFNANSLQTSIEESISLPSADGGLSTDGQFHFDNIENRLLYMHYYNNTILSFDTNLVLNKRFHTIDTISSKTRLGPGAPLISNQESCVDNGLLFICSNLKADNETFRMYRNNIPVDIYEISTGIYKGSFYLPLSGGKLIKSMKVHGNSLTALYHDNRLSLFKLHFETKPASRK